MPRQLTHDARHHVLDNNDNFSPDDRWLAYDERHDGIATNAAISRVEVATGRIESLYREEPAHPWGPGVGAASYHPGGGCVAFIRGLTAASPGRPYAMWRRTGVAVDVGGDRRLRFLDARDVSAPFTPGALRGGTHRHEWSDDGEWIGFTYNDAVMVEIEERTGRPANLRTIGVAARHARPVVVPPGPENHDGEFFSAVVVEVIADPRPGTDEISRAFEDAWVGSRGYRRPDGTWQRRARAFLGSVRTAAGAEIAEVFVVDLPERLDVAGSAGPLEGTESRMPAPPAGAQCRRLTFTADRRHPGLALEPRHWVRSSPDGSRIVFLAKDDAGIVQAHLVSPNGGPTIQATRHSASIESCVRWSPDGTYLLYVCGGVLVICDARLDAPTFGHTQALTVSDETPPFGPVWSRGGRTIAYNRQVQIDGRNWVQIFTLSAPAGA
jgi:hypothetical protein